MSSPAVAQHSALREELLLKIWHLYRDAACATGGDRSVGPSLKAEAVLTLVAERLEEDLHHFARVDPAAHGDPQLILDSYSAFACILHHRLAHAVLMTPIGDAVAARHRTARWLADQGKVMSGADIHPAARIGRRFVLDHAVGTVIGETAVIGDDCYMLGGVVLGARGISANPRGKRHPTIGHGVQIGGSARVLGPVTIGDGVFIAPHCIVTADVPSHTRVTVMNQLQLGSKANPQPTGRLRILGAGVVGQRILVLGDNFGAPSVEMLDEDFVPCPSVVLEAAQAAPNLLGIAVVASPSHDGALARVRHLRISDHGEDVVVLAPQGLNALLATRPADLCLSHDEPS